MVSRSSSIRLKNRIDEYPDRAVVVKCPAAATLDESSEGQESRLCLKTPRAVRRRGWGRESRSDDEQY
jgi:hypothetical protein